MTVEVSTNDIAAPQPAGNDAAGTRETVAGLYDASASTGADDGADPQPEGAASSEQPADAAPAGERSRDATGRFAKAAPAPAAEEAKPLRAPQSWRNHAKAEWDKLPRAVQEEVRRVDVEVMKTIERAATLDKTAAEWKAAYEPHTRLLDAAGMSPTQAVSALLEMHAAMEAGSPEQRAAMIARQARAYLGDNALALLSALLGGQPPEPPGPPSPEQLQRHIETQVRARLVQQEQQASDAAFRAFEASGPEFLNQPGMRQRVEVELIAMRIHGLASGPVGADEIKRAYEAACDSQPHIRAVLEQRKAAEKAKAATSQQASRAAAAASIKNEPAGPSGATGKAKNTREEMERQWTRLSSGRTRV